MPFIQTIPWLYWKGPPNPGAAGQVLTSNGGTAAPTFQPASGGGGGGIGADLSYSPSSGAVDPGAGISGFVAAAGTSGTGRLKVTLSGATTFAGLPAGADGQQLFIMVVAGAYSLTLTAFGTTAGAEIFASNSFTFQEFDCAHLLYDSALSQWVLVQ